MSFPPQFLDELRTRLPVSEVVGRRVTLQRRGREFLGLCPFHSDSKPSMNVVDDKNFYHCFACGAHGDIIKFVMETEGLAFPEAVEKLADMAGLEVPKETPQDRERTKRRETLHDVLEHACVWFEQKLAGPGGAEALEYLRRRGLTRETIARFRLGWAPDSRTAFAQSMKAEGVKEALLLEAGLLRKPEDGGAAYDYFRGRIIFPITDRRGRVIAFGGRILGDGQPKYLNSPDTPVFHKGRVLYGLAQAREAARKADEIVVAEGYMDVIALSQGGFPQAVAPLGTALTEDQIAELWKLATEPIVCFDGDTAGMRAAGRAADRVLPMLKPGHSLRFVTLPQGEDPDDVIKHHGAKAMRELLDGAIPLSEFIWRQELAAQPVTTPEKLADLRGRVFRKTDLIGERSLQEDYQDEFRRKLYELRQENWNKLKEKFGNNKNKQSNNSIIQALKVNQIDLTKGLDLAGQKIFLTALLEHPGLIDEFGEMIGKVRFSDPLLDKLRHEILDVAFSDVSLDAKGMYDHLMSSGFDEVAKSLLPRNSIIRATYVFRRKSYEECRLHLNELIGRFGKAQVEAHLADAEQQFAIDPSDDSWNKVCSLRALIASINSAVSLEEAHSGLVY